jgi:hypothetical protein
VTRDVTDSEAKAPIIVPLSRKVGIRATTPIAQSWRSVGVVMGIEFAQKVIRRPFVVIV